MPTKAAHDAHKLSQWCYLPQEVLPWPNGENEYLKRSCADPDNPGTHYFELTEKGRELLLSNVKGPYKEPHPEWERFCRENEMANNSPVKPGRRSLRYQCQMLLVSHPCIAFTREDLEAFVAAIGKASSDVIQLVNKSSQWGLKRKLEATRRYYTFPYPLEFDPSKVILRREPLMSKDDPQWLAEIRRIRARYAKLAQTPIEQFDEGHLDPRVPKGVVPQVASINRSLRDRYKFDRNGEKECPTVEHLAKNLRSFYSTDEELEILFEALHQELGKRPAAARA